MEGENRYIPPQEEEKNKENLKEVEKDKKDKNSEIREFEKRKKESIEWKENREGRIAFEDVFYDKKLDSFRLCEEKYPILTLKRSYTNKSYLLDKEKQKKNNIEYFGLGHVQEEVKISGRYFEFFNNFVEDETFHSENGKQPIYFTENGEFSKVPTENYIESLAYGSDDKISGTLDAISALIKKDYRTGDRINYDKLHDEYIKFLLEENKDEYIPGVHFGFSNGNFYYDNIKKIEDKVFTTIYNEEGEEYEIELGSLSDIKTQEIIGRRLLNEIKDCLLDYKYRKEFKSILDTPEKHKDFVLKIIEDGQGSFVINNFEKFTGIPKEDHKEIALELQKAGYGKSLIDNIEKFNINKEEADELFLQ
jgi:hypothetical protein